MGWLTRLKRTRRRWLVPAAALLGVLAGGGYGLLATPEYAATSYVIVVPSAKSDPAGAMGLAQAYGRVATDIAVTGDAQVAAGVSARTLRANVQAATSPDAPMIAITARAAVAATAAGMADSVARALVDKGSHTQGSTGVKVLQFTRAATPTSPVSPSPSLSALVGGCAGGLLGGLALLVRPRYPRRGERTRYGTVPGPVTQAEALV
ncbi:lipopolysaccharide biosynthesis protein [Streptomyces ficellus]|uniref:Lipopolysaccharide biosynthesis protein n=1 Tax=Streptomyces ficellus TaxID=1977088 RepID=A0A6I6FG15_9ACTN|nr:lipopolysaccharide biosynthesis protein [Streptomyces ficellus]